MDFTYRSVRETSDWMNGFGGQMVENVKGIFQISAKKKSQKVHNAAIIWNVNFGSHLTVWFTKIENIIQPTHFINFDKEQPQMPSEAIKSMKNIPQKVGSVHLVATTIVVQENFSQQLQSPTNYPILLDITTKYAVQNGRFDLSMSSFWRTLCTFRFEPQHKRLQLYWYGRRLWGLSAVQLFFSTIENLRRV